MEKSHRLYYLRLALIYLALFAILEALLLHFFVLISVHGTSMEPTLQDGDRIVIRAASDLETGQVVVFTAPASWASYAGLEDKTRFVKRVLAAPGDELRFDGRTFFVNGKASTKGPRYSCMGEPFTHVLGKDQLFVAGDHASVSVDSRRLFCEGLPNYYVPVKNVNYTGKILLNF